MKRITRGKRYLFLFTYCQILIKGLGKIYKKENLNFDFDTKKEQNQFLNVEKRLHKRNLELYWTLIPALILFIIGAPSLSVLYSISELVAPELTIKAIGNQWFWTYEYSLFMRNGMKSLDEDLQYWKDNKPIWLNNVTWRPRYVERVIDNYKDIFGVRRSRMLMSFIKFTTPKHQLRLYRTHYVWEAIREFDELIFDESFSKMESIKGPQKLIYESHMILEDELKPGELRLLEVDYWLILPINVEIRVLVSSADVIHSFAVPSLGIKVDGVPGRTNEVPLFIKRKGIFYGQCSELCGVNHGFMPIVVQAMNKTAFTDIMIEFMGWKKFL